MGARERTTTTGSGNKRDIKVSDYKRDDAGPRVVPSITYPDKKNVSFSRIVLCVANRDNEKKTFQSRRLISLLVTKSLDKNKINRDITPIFENVNNHYIFNSLGVTFREEMALTG